MKPILLLLAILNVAVFADEPLWTDKERAKLRDSVIEGKVISNKKVSSLDKFEDLYLAEIQVIKVKKGKGFEEGTNLNVYYEFAPNGGRCPRYPEIKLGEIADFYLVEFNEEISKRLKVTNLSPTDMVVWMNSDIRRKKTEPADTDNPGNPPLNSKNQLDD